MRARELASRGRGVPRESNVPGLIAGVRNTCKRVFYCIRRCAIRHRSATSNHGEADPAAEELMSLFVGAPGGFGKGEHPIHPRNALGRGQDGNEHHRFGIRGTPEQERAD